jgi:NAD-dependent DNA ligase
MIKGIGPIYAKKLVRAFSEAVFDVIEQKPERLQEVDGIGPKRAKSIVAAWADQKAIREIMIFLHANGVSTARAVRIFKPTAPTPFASSPRTRIGSPVTSAASASRAPISSPRSSASRRRR